MSKVEIVGLRKENERHYLNANGIVTAVLNPISEDNTFIIEDITISSNQGNNSLAGESLLVGVDGILNDGAINRSLIKFPLPELPDSATIKSAILILNGALLSSRENAIGQVIDVHEVTHYWDKESVLWDDIHNQYNNRVEDCFMSIRSLTGEEKNSVSVNITNVVKKWYNGSPNYGIMLKAHNEVSKEGIGVAKFDTTSTYESNSGPMLHISYVSDMIIDDNVPCKTVEYSRGASFVNIYNGNLTSKFNLVEVIGGDRSINLELFHNNNDVINNNFYGLPIGWKFNYYQTITLVDGLNDVLCYINEEGKKIYLSKMLDLESDSYVYIDEDETMKLIQQNSDYLLEYDDCRLLFKLFGNIWYLSEILDETDDRIVVSYNEENKIIKIEDSYNNIVNIAYEVDKIVINTMETTCYIDILDDKISCIKINNDIINILYNANKLIESIVDSDGIRKSFSYNLNFYNKVSEICEYGNNDEIGANINFTYGVNNTSIVDNKGRINNYIFNDDYTTVCLTNMNETSNFYNAHGICGVNSENDNIEDNLSCNLQLIKSYENYIKNPSFESDYENISDFNLHISNEEAHTGNRSAKINDEFDTISTYVEVPENKCYVLSFFAKTTSPNINVVLEYYQRNPEIGGQLSYVTSTFEASDEWKKYEVMIELENAQSVNGLSTIYVYIGIDSQNVGYFDDFKLEEGETSSDQNLIDNYDFFSDTDFWNLSSYNENGEISESEDYEIISLNNFKKAIRLKSDLEKSIQLSKQIGINGKKGDTYNFSFWFKNNGIKSTLNLQNGAKLLITYDYIETGDEQDESNYLYVLPIAENLWQYFDVTVEALNDFNGINLSIISDYDLNDLCLTDFVLRQTETNFSHELVLENISNDIYKNIVNEINKYNVTNKIITKTVSGEDVNSVYYIKCKDGNKYLTANFVTKELNLTDEAYQTWKIEFIDNLVRLKSNINHNYYLNILNDQVVLGYSKQCLFELIAIENSNYMLKMKDSDKYLTITNEKLLISSDKFSNFYFESFGNNEFIETGIQTINNVEIEYDDIGNKTELHRISNERFDNKIFNRKGIETISIYDDKGNLIQKSQLNKCIKYQYNKSGMLHKVQNNDKIYTFEYDNFKNQTSFKINDTKILENQYEFNNGNLKNTTYSNGGVVNYTYDSFDRIKQLSKGEEKYYYTYDRLNRLKQIMKKEYSEGDGLVVYCKTIYNYDNHDRLCSIIELTSNAIQTAEYNCQYSNSNMISREKYKAYNNELTYDYDYYNCDLLSYNSLKQIKINDMYDITYYYDNLGRLSEKNFWDRYLVKYKYISNGRKTSNLIKEIINYNDTISYVYDKMKNITHIYINNQLTNRYIYDDYNQLVMEENYITHTLTKYVYDDYGNILLKQICDSFDYKTKELYEFKYSSEKNDQLIKCNNDELTYDQYGNIKTDGIFEYSWSYGLELDEVKKGESVLAYYHYNQNGIRTSKTFIQEDNYVVHSFKLDENNNIVFEKREDDVIMYLYELNQIIGFIYKNNIYFFTKNATNDILGIIDYDGNVVASYTYDSWGNHTVYNYSTDNIGDVNRFRYKGYYYDVETGLYYLNSRYYNPKLGRFISIDTDLDANNDILSNNLYLYCSNNHINYYDNNGKAKKNVFFDEKFVEPFKKEVFNPIRFQRLFAVSYAFKYWIKANKKQYPKFPLDCANFVSQCLYAGGVPMDEKKGWYCYKKGFHIVQYKRYKCGTAWSAVPEQRNWLLNCRYFSGKTIDIMGEEKIAMVSMFVKPGDIAYMVTSNRRKGDFTHAVIITDVENKRIFYAGHSESRRRYSLSRYFEGKVKGHVRRVRFYLMKG